jgi:hypothetical protein
MARTLDELISGARSAPRQHRDVQITLDLAVAAQVEALEARIGDLEQQEAATTEAADRQLEDVKLDARLGDPRGDEVRVARDARIAELVQQIETLTAERDALTEGTLLTFRFEALPGQAWAEIAARNPGRADVMIDIVYGYNYHETAKAAARYRDAGEAGHVYAHLVVDADDEAAEPTLEPVTAEQWDGIFDVISGHEFERIASRIWELNDYGPQQRIVAAGKASRAGSVNRSS